MKYINPNSKRGLVNKFADFILNEINKEKEYLTKIQVTLYNSFFIVDGITMSENVLEFTSLKQTFQEQNKDLLEKFGIKNINLIDLILYNKTFPVLEYHHFEFFNSKNPRFDIMIEFFLNSNDISSLESVDVTNKIELEYDSILKDNFSDYFSKELNLCVSSEFPYGYSLDAGRSHFYYSEYLAYNLFHILLTDRMEIKFTTKVVNDDIDIKISANSQYTDEQIKSLVLDVFDFNIPLFVETFVKDYDLTKEIDNQLEQKPWLVKDKIKDLIII